jgi:glutaredoxin
MEDPLSSDPNGGGGDPEENESPEMEDPFSSDPNGGGGDPGENGSPEMEDPFSNDPNGGGGDPEANQSPEMSDPFTDDPFGGGDPEENQSPGMGDPFSEDPFSQAGTVCEVVVYGTSWCGYCTKTKDLLKAQGVSFLDKDIEKDAGAQAEMEAKMDKAGMAKGGVPVIDFCGRIIKGYNEGLLLELCQNQGKK